MVVEEVKEKEKTFQENVEHIILVPKLKCMVHKNFVW